MIDFVKIQVKDLDVDQWMKKMPVKYQYSRDSDNNDIWITSKSGNDYKWIRANFENIEIKIREVKQYDGTTQKFLILEGSIHKFLRKENHSQFPWSELQYATEKLSDLFHVKPEMCHLSNLEYGVNMTIDQRPINLLTDNLLSYLGKALNHYDPDENGKKIGNYLKLTNYIIKIYDKGLQYGLKGQNILRFEIHSKRMRDIRETGITTLKDLTDFGKVNQLKPILMERWNNLRFIDNEVDEKMIPEDKKKIFIIGRSLPEQKKVPYKKRAQYRNDFKELMAKYGIDYSKKYELELSNTWDNLMIQKEVFHQLPKVNELNSQVEVIHRLHESISSPSKLSPKEVIHPKVENNILPKCKVTGIPLIGKAKDFITTNMVYKIKESDPSLFNKLRKGFCKNFSGLSDNVVCERIAHNVRNHYWNGKYIQVKNSNVGSLLFD